MENELTISNVKNEKEEFIKNKLSEWCNKQSEGRISNFANDIKILEVTESDIYKIDFYTRFVQRSFLEQTMPFKGQNIPKQKGNLPDLWAFETENINHSGEDVEEPSQEIVDEENKKELSELQKKLSLQKKLENEMNKNLEELNMLIEKEPAGFIKYHTEHSELHNKISNIQYEIKDIERKISNIENELKSSSCVDDIRKESFEDNAAFYALPETYELTDCPECMGKGKVLCYRCYGSGRVLNYDNKRVYCPKCEGAKKLFCSTCDGKGKVIKYIGIAEFFTFSKITKFLENNIPTGFYTKLIESPNYKKTDSIELFQDNYKEVLTSNETISKNSDISKAIFDYIMQTGNQLNDNQRINKYTIDISNLKTLIVKYDFNGKEYTIVLFGDNYEICAPEGTYPKEIRKIETKINKINKTLENLDASKKSRLSTLLLCLFLGLFGIHRFYVGKIKSGLLQILLPFFTIILIAITELDVLAMSLLFCLIWYCVDLFSILFGKFKDKDKNYIKKWI